MLRFLLGFIVLAFASITGVGCSQHSSIATGSVGAENPPPPRVETDSTGHTTLTFDAMPEETATTIQQFSAYAPVKEVTLNEAQQLQSITVARAILPETLELIDALTEEVLLTGFTVDDNGVLIGFSYLLPADAGIENGFDADVESLTFGPDGRVESWVNANPTTEVCQLHVFVNQGSVTFRCSGDCPAGEGCGIFQSSRTISSNCVPLPGG